MRTHGELLRILGVGFGIAVIIGSTIGAGILRTPGAVVAQVGSGPFAILIWAAGGLYALLGAAALADLATTIPKSGGFYVYARRALGARAGLVVGCADWFSNTAFVAYGAITFGEYAVLLGLGNGRLLGAASIVGFTALQLFGMRVSSRVQEVTSFLKAVAFVALIAVLFVAAPGAPAEARLAAAPALPGFVAVILALQLVIGAYDGWQAGMYFAGEDTQPARNLPRAFIGGVLLVVVVYLLMNAALMRVLPLDQLAASELPAADAARAVFGEGGGTLITALSFASLLPLIFAVLLTSTRILYAMADDGGAPARLAYVNRGTPAYALLASAAMALAFTTTRTFDAIATVAAFFAVASYAGAFVSLLVLRHREPDLPRPFRSWGYPWTTAGVLAGAIALLAGMVAAALSR